MGFLFDTLTGIQGFNVSTPVEILTSKKQQTITNTTSNQISNQTTFTDARNLSIISNSPNSAISPSTTISPNQTPTTSIIPTIIPTLGSISATPSGTSSSNTGNGLSDIISNTGGLILISALVVGGVFIYKGVKKK